MPTINGQKVACEPCIRGHRSTKCTHHNERLMVPVRKPGRPLSACPHPANQKCACGSVTAAIPRKQQCGCGTEEPFVGQQNMNASMADAPSPTKVAFRVQKPSSRPLSRKQSYDPANFVRMDMSSVNILPYEQQFPPLMQNGYGSASPSSYSYPLPQYAEMQPGYRYVAVQPVPMHSVGGQVVANGRTHEGANGLHSFTSLDKVMESPLNPPSSFQTNGVNGVPNGRSCCSSKKNGPAVDALPTAGSCCGPNPKVEGVSNGAPRGSSCCAPKLSHSHTSSTASSVSEPPEPQAGGCCSSRPQLALKMEPGAMDDNAHAQMAPPLSPQDGLPLFSQYITQPTVFTYPAAYGSFQRPLQPSEWKQSVQTYWQQPPPTDSMSFGAPQIPETLDTVHTCGCGDTCQCIGCAAHPYNEATQQYVRSAWSSMTAEGPFNPNKEEYAHENNSSTTNMETVASPTAAHTPSSAASNNGEDQALSATDFFFVNYPFTSDGCGGDTQSCPCGDDCECLGCTIHRGPSIPCPGDEQTCPCGDDCQCIGCIIHNGGTV